MKTKLYDYQLHDEICALCMKLSDLSLVNDQLIFRNDGSVLDPYDYVYVDFEGRNIYGEDEDGYFGITGVFLWGDCSIEFRVAPADAPEDGDFVSWSDYNEDMLEKIVNNLKFLLVMTIEEKIRLAEQRYLQEKVDSWKRDIEERKKNLRNKYKSIDEYWNTNK